MNRTIVNPISGSPISSSVMRNELQTLEDEISAAGLYNVDDYGAVGDGTTDDTAAIQAAIAAAPSGAIVQFGPKSYAISSPLVLPPNTGLRGTIGGRINFKSVSNEGTQAVANVSKLVLLASFSGLGAIWLKDKEQGGYSYDTAYQSIRDLIIDGALASGAVDGIYASGKVLEVTIENVSLQYLPGNGINCVNYTRQDASVKHPYSWTIRHTYARTCAGIGYSLANMTDCQFSNMATLGCGSYGWYIVAAHNSTFTACRAEWSGSYGFYITGNWGTGQGSGGALFMGLSTDRNKKDGIFIDATGSGQLNFNGLMLRRDGRNSGSGGGNYAAFHVSASTMRILVDAITVFPGVDDDGSQTNSPQIGVTVESSSSFLLVSSGYIHAATTAWNDDASNTFVSVGLQVGLATGTTSSPTRVPPRIWVHPGFATGGKGMGIGADPNKTFEVSDSVGTTFAPTTFTGFASALTNRSTTNNSFAEYALNTLDANGTWTTGVRIVGVFMSHTANAVSAALAFIVRNAGTMLEAMRIMNNGQIGIGTNAPGTNILVDMTSTTMAFAPPRMSTTQKAAISSPSAGMVVYDTTLNKLCVYTGAAWETIVSA